MNTARDIITYAEQHNIHISTREGQLILNAQKEALTNEFLESAKQHKTEILSVITKRWNPEQDIQAEKLIEAACRRLEITPVQFITLCTKEDLEYIRNGNFSIETLRAYAASFAEGIRTKRIVIHPTIEKLIRHN